MLRELIVSNKHLRIIRNDLMDRYRSTKYQIRISKDKLINNSDLNSKEPDKLLTEKGIKEKYEYIKKKNSSIIDLHPFEDNAPLVSLLILNKNGYTHLKRLFKNFIENIQYPNLEIIIVDNASTDNSLNYLQKISSTGIHPCHEPRGAGARQEEKGPCQLLRLPESARKACG